MKTPRPADSRDIAARCRAARLAAGMSLAQAGAAIGVHSTAVVSYEMARAAPAVGTLYRLAEAYGLTLAEFFSLDVSELLEASR